MQRWQSSTYGSASNLELVTLPSKPIPSSHQLLLRILTTSATYTDQLIIHGNYRPKFPLPVTPGYDAIGIVESIGDKVTNFQIGDTVAIMPQGGCATTYLCINADKSIKINLENLTPELALSVVLTGITAYQMVHRAAGSRIVQSPNGSLTTYPLASSSSASSSSNTSSSTRYARILVHSCTGATGSMIVQIAKAAGLPSSNIYGTCSTKNLTVATEQMGIQALDYTLNTWENDILKLTNNEGVDVIFDAIILNLYYERGMSCLATNGKYIGYGVTNSNAPGSLVIPSVIGAFTKLTLQNYVYSWFNKKETEFYNIAERRISHAKDFETDLYTLLEMVKKNTLQPVIGKIWSFQEVKEALLSIENNQNIGRQIIKVGSNSNNN